jgi:peptidoglycan/xylan/chitin deacetylase (PgdA/CDA1 family)
VAGSGGDVRVGDLAGTYHRDPRRPPARNRPRRLLVIIVLLVVAGLTAAWLGSSDARAGRLRVAWTLSAASDTVTVRLLTGGGAQGSRILARSRLAVEERSGGRLRRWSGGTIARVPVRPGRRTALIVAVAGPQPLHRTLTFTVPAQPKLGLYCFAHSAGRAVYITIDDGWTPSVPVLALMRRTHLPVTAFLIERAAREHLGYWRAFVRAGGMIGDHTVSHPDLTTLTYAQATYQWAQARRVLGRWFGRAPVLGRPPYGSFNATVEAAAYAAGLKDLAGWSATVAGNRVQTWNGRPLEPGEIVILHWVPGLARQMTTLLAAIHARHLNPRPLTPASFSGIAPQRHSLKGD